MFRRRQTGAEFSTTEKLVSNLPPIPADVKTRFPSMVAYEQQLKDWHTQLLVTLSGGATNATGSTAPTPGKTP
jgi:hypothetical protein